MKRDVSLMIRVCEAIDSNRELLKSFLLVVSPAHIGYTTIYNPIKFSSCGREAC
jgi:hypothetical protein